MGISYSGVTMEEMMVRTVESPEGTGEKFSVSNVAIGLAYAKRLTDKFSFGVNLKNGSGKDMANACPRVLR